MPDSAVVAKTRTIDFRSLVPYLSFILILIFFSIMLHDRGFLSTDNLMNILRQTAMVSIMAVGMTFTLTAGEIDLSIGAVVALAALVCAVILKRTESLALAVPAALAVGVGVGLVNGFITTKARIPAFLVTLGTSGIVAGMARSITNLEAVPIIDRNFTFIFGSGDVGSVSTLFLWTALFMGLGHVLLKRTPFGRAVLATGGNRSAARYTGIRTDRIRVAVLVLASVTAAFAGLLYAGRLHGARYTLGDSDLMTVIAAVIIGGTSFSGGRGSVFGAIIGSIVMGMLNNGLLLMGLSVSEQMMARGAIIIAAVSLSLREAKES